ncbi:ataxin-2-like protein [Pollicipes pollicipes]|uniref:ataxin-2-like protein n=1 Tax=Pollicipes pollicipes TaxID=41117 RepID=UPI001884AE9B|nr:ataxin-2-like protein [Pollicipes pollicipes]
MNSGGQGNRPKKTRSAAMSNSNNNARYRTKESRSGPHRPPLEASGVYADPKYAHVLTSVLGCTVQVLTTAHQRFEGVLESLSSDNDAVLGMVNLVNEAHPKQIDPKEVKDRLIFKPDQIVMMSMCNVDLDYAAKTGFQTDAAIQGKTNGGLGPKELQPWVEDDAPAELVSLENSNGWDARDMFRMNEKMYGVKSTFDQTLAGYTTPLEHTSRDQEAHASRIADEIERSTTSRHRADAENGDEEAAFAAVVRPGGPAAERAGQRTPEERPPPAPAPPASEPGRRGDTRQRPPQGGKSAIAGLKDFRQNFVLSDGPPRKEEAAGQSTHPTPPPVAGQAKPEPPPAASPAQTPDGKSGDAVDKLAGSLNKSKLNPNAKSFTPSQPASMPPVGYSPAPTPPRAPTPQMALAPSQFPSLLAPTGYPSINYIMPGGQPFSMPQQQPPRLQKQRGEYPQLSGLQHRAEATPMQVAAVTGQPLMAPSPMAGHPGAPHLPLQLPQSGLLPPAAQHYPGQPQMIVRMLPAHAPMYQQQQQPPPQPQPYDGQQGGPPPPGPHQVHYGMVPQGPVPAQPPTPGPAPGAGAPGLMYQVAGGGGGAAGAGAGGPYPPSSMYLVSAGQQMQAAHFAMMQGQSFSGPMTSTVTSMPMSLGPQPYYIPHQQHAAQTYGPAGVHPMPLVPNPNH